MPAAANVINFSNPRRVNEFNECFDKIETVDVIPHLFPCIRRPDTADFLLCRSSSKKENRAALSRRELAL